MYIDRTYQVLANNQTNNIIDYLRFWNYFVFRIHYTFNSQCKIESALGIGQKRDIVG